MSQQNTFSLCNECYANILAVADPFDDICPTLYKICPAHGLQRGKLEKDREFYQQFNTYDRYNHNKAGIISITDKCNVSCKHCYYPTNKGMGDMPVDMLRQIIEGNLWLDCIILSGGEPTCHANYLEIIKEMNHAGVNNTMLTNGILLNDDVFFNEAVRSGIIAQERVKAQISIHGPGQQGEKVHAEQMSFLAKCRRRGLGIHMAMINLEYGPDGHSIVEEVEKVINFMNEWRDVIPNFRVRTVCNVWNANNAKSRGYNSDIYKQFQLQAFNNGKEFNLSNIGDVNNIYSINTTYDGMNLSMMAAPDLASIDLGYLGRSPYMLANDVEWYTVPHALIVNDGMSKGWHRGKNLRED